MTKDTIYLIRTTTETLNHDREVERISVRLDGDLAADEVLEKMYYFMLNMGYSPDAIGRTFQELGDIYGPRDDD